MPTTDYVRYIMALLVVLGLIFLLGQLAQKYNWASLGIKLASRNNKRFRVIEMQAIDNRHKLLLARRDNIEYVLAVSPDRVILLDTLQTTSPPPVNDPSEAHPT